MKIVLLSDTHGHMDERILRHAEACDEVWHAGDIGNVQVTDQLSEVAHCRAVYGNIDGEAVRRTWPEDQIFELEGLTFWMTHIGGRPPKYARGILPQLKSNSPDVFICGHSHILLVKRVASWGGLHLNPGAAGRSGFHKVCTMLKFDVLDGSIDNMKVVEWAR